MTRETMFQTVARTTAAGYGFIAGMVLLAAPQSASAQLRVDEVCTVVSTACVAPDRKPAIRRGVTEIIKIKGPFVNQTNLSGVTTGNPGVTVSRVVGTNCGAIGCLDMTVKVVADHNLGIRLVPIFIKNIFGTTAFNVYIVRRGEITDMIQNPADAVWGNSVGVTIRGYDIGNTRASVARSGVYNHVEAPSGSGLGTTTFTVVAGETTTPSTSTGVTLGDDDVSGIPGNYRFTSTKRTVDYRPATATSNCATTPGIAAPAPSTPTNGQIFTFTTTNPVQASITLTWSASQSLFKSTEQYIVEVGPIGGTAAVYTTAQGITSKALSLSRNTNYRWRVRAWNCGQGAPFSAYSNFTVQ